MIIEHFGSRILLYGYIISTIMYIQLTFHRYKSTDYLLRAARGYRI